MKNWRLWIGFLLSIASFVSYFVFFYRFPITRDVPWVDFILFIAATVLLIAGVRRSQRKIRSGIVAFLGVAVFAFFVFAVTVASRQLPPSHGAPQVGQKAPDFTVLDSNAEFLIDGTGTVRWTNLTEDLRIRARPERMLAAAQNVR